jgi:hypothetical protein
MSEEYMIQDETKSVQLRPWQVPHFDNVVDTVRDKVSYIDVSEMGAGKTLIVLKISQMFGLPVIVVCPKSTQQQWVDITTEYGILLIDTITYSGLRGSKIHSPHHGLLTRNGDKFEPTQRFRDLVANGLLLVFDEFHNVKNDNSQFMAAHTLVKEVIRLNNEGAVARIALLSATPCDKKEHAVSLLKMLGIITQDKLYNYDKSTKMYNLIGLQEAIDKCSALDPDTTFNITCRSINRTTVNTICHDLFVLVIKKHYVSAMPLVLSHSNIKDAKNGYYMMSAADDHSIASGIRSLSSAVCYRHDTRDVDIGRGCWGDITTSLMMIEGGKVNTIIRLVKEQLSRNPQSKAVIYLNYLDHMNQIYQELKAYGALYMDGQTSSKSRSEIIRLFQEDNCDYRILVTNPKVGGVGINLDDSRSGKYPRFMYIVPTYNFIELQQSINRIYRVNTKSTATIRIIYSKKNPHETSILNAIARKKNVVRDIIIDHNNSITLLGEYNIEVEGNMADFDISATIAKPKDVPIRLPPKISSTSKHQMISDKTKLNKLRSALIPEEPEEPKMPPPLQMCPQKYYEHLLKIAVPSPKSS